MKLSLGAQDGVSILVVTGEVDQHNFSILKAGLSKLFRDGKNKIVLNLEDATTLDGAILRELAILDVFARELSGKIILTSSNAELKESVRLFSRPPVIPIFSTVALATEYFKQSAEEGEPEDPKVLREKLDAQEKENSALAERLKLTDAGALTAIRAENAELKRKLALMEKRVEALVVENRAPVDAEGFLEKIHALEASVKRLGGEAPGKA